MACGIVRGYILTIFMITTVSAYIVSQSARRSCTSNAYNFRCLNGECTSRLSFCDGANDCGDNSDERYCAKNYFMSCPPELGWIPCANDRRCYPSTWKCDNRTDCPDGSDEINCPVPSCTFYPDKFRCLNGKCIPQLRFCDGADDCGDNSDERNCVSNIRAMNGVQFAERNLTRHFLGRTRQESRSINKWGPHIARAAVALFLNHRQFFAPKNKTGGEIGYELSVQLLSKLALKKRLSTKDLALYINALTVACINPNDFFGIDMVAELRKRVNSSNNTNPFSVLALCNANDKMTTEDVQKLQQQYDAHLRPLWTDTQAIVVMALSCISSRSDVYVDERILRDMVSELKKKQFRNGTVENLKTTALVVQALLATGSYEKDFDLDAAIKFILKELRQKYPPIQDIYYILPIFNSMSFVNISSDHCATRIKTDLEVIKDLRENSVGRIEVQVSVIVGDNKYFSRTWKVKVPSNYSYYQVLETIGALEPAYKVKYSVSDGKPYVTSLASFQDDTEEGSYWFIYSKPLSSTANPKLIEESPVDIQVKENEELILWYKSETGEILKKILQPDIIGARK